jgi:hypothetical protein
LAPDGIAEAEPVALQLARAWFEVELRLVEQQPRTQLGQLREVAEVDRVRRVVRRVVLGALERLS